MMIIMNRIVTYMANVNMMNMMIYMMINTIIGTLVINMMTPMFMRMNIVTEITSVYLIMMNMNGTLLFE